MLTNLGFNLILLMMSDYVFVLGASNIGYLIFNFLNLNAGWIHRMDRPDQERPWKAPTAIIAAGTVLSFVNLAFVGMGADVYGEGTLRTGLLFALLIVPIFGFRHYLQDKGRFPSAMLDEMELGEGAQVKRRAGVLPYLALALGVAVVYVTHRIAVY
jgi:amino acid transporter